MRQAGELVGCKEAGCEAEAVRRQRCLSHYRSLNAAYQRNWRSRDVANLLKGKAAKLRKDYGITMEDYMAMYTAQDGKCGICRKSGAPFTAGDGRAKTLAVDHDHATGAIRKLLCHRCNNALGCFGDSTELLQQAVAYLKQHAQ